MIRNWKERLVEAEKRYRALEDERNTITMKYGATAIAPPADRTRTAELEGEMKQVQKEIGQVAEGVRNARSVNDLAARLAVDMPISSAVYRMLYEKVPAQVAVGDLFGRETKAEIAG